MNPRAFPRGVPHARNAKPQTGAPRHASGVARLALRTLALAALLCAGAVASGAFAKGSLPARVVEARIVGDGAAYLALGANPSSPHQCFVLPETNGKVALDFGATTGCAGDGGGTGVNAGVSGNAAKYARYAFHDILRVTNKGTKSVYFFANATTTSSTGTLAVAKSGTEGRMVDADYAATSAAGVLVAPGGFVYVGVRVDGGTTSAGGAVAGKLVLEARR